MKKNAMKILINSHFGLTFDEWCKKLKEEFPGADNASIENTISNLVKTHWKVEKLEEEKRGTVYVHHDLIK